MSRPERITLGGYVYQGRYKSLPVQGDLHYLRVLRYIVREDWQLVEAEPRCAYCGSVDDLHKEHIVPRSLRIRPECADCDTIQGIHNQVWACGPCNLAKSDKGLYRFYRESYPGEKKYYDLIPPLLEKKYLKTIYDCHVCAGTLNGYDIDGDGEVTVLDIDHIIG